MSDFAASAPRPGDGIASVDSLVVVGLSVSAGALHALEQFFRAAPASSAIAYIVLLHGLPRHSDRFVESLRRRIPIPVSPVRGRTPLQPHHVYVVAPHECASLAEGRLETAPMNLTGGQRGPLDLFFRTLAETRRTRAVSVILSGAGDAGSIGMKRLKECGGLCIAQEPDEAEIPDMPRNAIATGLVDAVLPVSLMGRCIAIYQRQMTASASDAETEAHAQALLDVVALLSERTGHDFARYKSSVLSRGIARRMSVHALPAVASYVKHLGESRGEAGMLARDLRISVTHFFRDPESWEALERHAVPKLFESRGPDDRLRVWVAGCATGEEAYSVAMLLAEHAPDPLSAPTVQVFATDIDRAALSKARAGRYTPDECADVAPQRRQRFFVKDGDAWRVRRELREMVLFAPHDAIAETPFSHLDLVCCRNLLSDLDPAARKTLMRSLRFALNPGGFLFLGDCERVEDCANRYFQVQENRPIYRLCAAREPGEGPQAPDTTSPETGAGMRISSQALQASREALRSLDKELGTVNQELRIRIDELSEANNDTRNLMNSTDLATVFVDRALRIKLFTPRARSIFGLTAADVGRRFAEISHRLHYPDLMQDVARVLDSSCVAQREVHSADQRAYIARILPYRTAEDRVAGAVLTFTDITERSRIEEELRAAREQLEARVAERTRELAAANDALRREIEERAQAETTRLRLLRQLVCAQEDERRRISRELHDQLGQEVTALGLRIAAIKATPEATGPLRAQIEILEGIVKQLDNDVDFLVWELRPTGLDDLGLAEALSDYTATWSKHFGVPVALRSHLRERLSTETETLLYRIGQEALNNVAKHAQATRVQIALERHADHVSLTVQDDGIGFDTSEPLDSHSLGLLGMRERAGLAGGTVSIDSGPGGTTIHVRVPA